MPKPNKDSEGKPTKPRLLLTHLSAMNDPQEGWYLFNHLIKNTDQSKSQDIDVDIDLADNTIFNIFVTSFSGREDDLSQWRAYGDNAGGVALGFELENLSEEEPLKIKSTPFSKIKSAPSSLTTGIKYRPHSNAPKENTLAYFFGKVRYVNLDDSKKDKLREILDQAKNLIKNTKTSEKARNAIYSALGLLAAFVKHPDYEDEQEYRYVAIGGNNDTDFYNNDKTGLTTPCRYCDDDWFLQNVLHTYTLWLGPKVQYVDNIKLAIRSRLKGLDQNKLIIKKSEIDYR